MKRSPWQRGGTGVDVVVCVAVGVAVNVEVGDPGVGEGKTHCAVPWKCNIRLPVFRVGFIPAAQRSPGATAVMASRLVSSGRSAAVTHAEPSQ